MSKPLIAVLGIVGLIAISTTFLSVDRSGLISPFTVTSTKAAVSPPIIPQEIVPQADVLEAMGYVGSDLHDGKYRGPAVGEVPAAGSPVPVASAQASYEPPAQQTPASQSTTSPKLVWSGTLQVEVDDPRATGDKLRGEVERLGGYVASLNEYSGGLNLQVSMTVRIPADQLDTALESLAGIGKVLQRTLNSQDMTLRYSDLDSRIRNLEAAQERLLTHLSASNTIETTLQVEKELTRVLENLEVLQGQMNALSDLIDYATITVTLSSTPQAGPVVPYESFSTAKTATDAARALSAFARDFWIRMIWFGVWLPVWLPLTIIAWLVQRRLRRGRTTSK